MSQGLETLCDLLVSWNQIAKHGWLILRKDNCWKYIYKAKKTRHNLRDESSEILFVLDMSVAILAQESCNDGFA